MAVRVGRQGLWGVGCGVRAGAVGRVRGGCEGCGVRGAGAGCGCGCGVTLQKVMAARTTSCALCCSRLHTVCSSCTEVCTIASRVRYAYTWWGVAHG